jgi:hypothetical protein
MLATVMSFAANSGRLKCTNLDRFQLHISTEFSENPFILSRAVTCVKAMASQSWQRIMGNDVTAQNYPTSQVRASATLVLPTAEVKTLEESIKIAKIFTNQTLVKVIYLEIHKKSPG